MDTPYKVKVLEKAIKVLDLFSDREKGFTITEMSGRLNLKMATVFRIVKTFEQAGFLYMNPDNKEYFLGLKLYHLGLLAEPRTRITRIARPFLESLNEKSGETVHLVVLHQNQSLYVDKIEGRRTIRVMTNVGMKLPAHCSGVGKVLLAALTEEEVDRVILKTGLVRFTANTLTDPGDLKAELARTRDQGYAIDNEEIEEGLVCVAAPVYDGNRTVVAAVSVSAPKDRVLDNQPALIALVTGTARHISEALSRLDIVIEP